MNRPIVKIRVLKSKAALRAMVEVCIARGIAERMQGKTFNAMLCSNVGADLVPDQGVPSYYLPPESFKIYASTQAKNK